MDERASMRLSLLGRRLPVGVREQTSAPLIETLGLGVKYRLGSKGEDIQSLAYDILHGVWRARQKRERWALRDVAFAGYPGDIWGIVGANGAGKTTFCRVLSRLLRPDVGTLHLRGEVSALLSLGVGFNQELSGRENIFLNGMMLGFSKKDMHSLAPGIVEFSGLHHFIDQPLKQYSSGMKARLGFSIAAMVEPHILIIDEGLSVGDLAFSAKAGHKMRELVEKAKLVILVSHQLEFVERYCTQAVWLDQGMLKAKGIPHEVVAAYKASKPPKKAVLDLYETKTRHGSAQVVSVNQLGVRFLLQKLRQPQGAGMRQFLSSLVSTKREELWALQDVTFTLKEGDILGIIGPNGAGKTTLCKVLSGILRADHGTVDVAGEISALLALNAGFHAQLSGKDNIYLRGLMLGVSKHWLMQVYTKIVEFSGLATFIDEPIKHYSQGMRTRLGFSITAMLQPDVLILDEALSVGDIAFYEKASEKIQELIKDAKAVIVVTHNLDFAEKVCTRVLWLDTGTVRFDGDPKEAVAEYRQSLKPRKPLKG